MDFKLDVENTFKPTPRTFSLPNKLLVGAGPSNCSPKVLAALLNHTLTPICREHYQMMDDVKELLKYVFQTRNNVTLALQASGTGGLEAAVTNLVDPGEKMLVAVGGVWGERSAEKAAIRKIDVVKIKSNPGEVFALEELEREIAKHRPVMLFITHGESSNGTVQPLAGLGDICHKYNCLLAVDAVASLGGVPFFTDRWGVDAAVSATQKAIGAPPGMALLTFSPRAVQKMKSLKTRPPFYYNVLQLSAIWNCFGSPRKYYITYNSHMIAAVREALIQIASEGLQNAWARHERLANRFYKELTKMGITHFVPNPEHRLNTVTIFNTPEKIKWAALVDYLEEKHKVAIGYGIGPSLHKAMRIGFMGYNAREEVVDYVLEVLKDGIAYCQSEAGQNGVTYRSEVI